LDRGRPVVAVVLLMAEGEQFCTRMLLADTGAGSAQSGFDLILQETDCLRCGGIPSMPVQLSGAWAGRFPTYILRVQLPALAFDRHLRVVGVSKVPLELEGIACFSFLNRFNSGNFGDPGLFGLET
jgi:hypothetical protein